MTYQENQSTVIVQIEQEQLVALDEILQQLITCAELEINPDEINQLADLSGVNKDPLRLLGLEVDSATITERLSILRNVYPKIKAYKNNLNIGASLLPECFLFYIPIAQYMAARSHEIRGDFRRAAVFGINGGQGSGKTTINVFLQIILREGLGFNTSGFSIDDVYKTFEQRQQMAQRVHPLFAIRSVAGTHDTKLAISTLNALVNSTEGSKIQLPGFDKMARGGQGDRMPEAEWPVVEGQVDMVIFEGWCVGARPQDDISLKTPVNEREKTEDPDGIWRQAMNRLLASDYQQLFDMMDDLLVIQVRSMEDIYQNRELQEQHLRQQLAAAKSRGEDTGDQGAMSHQEVIDFISLYERTTRHMLAILPDQARLTLYIGDHHRVEQFRANKASPSLRGHAPDPA